jgi:hypothetical protein
MNHQMNKPSKTVGRSIPAIMAFHAFTLMDMYYIPKTRTSSLQQHREEEQSFKLSNKKCPEKNRSVSTKLFWQSRPVRSDVICDTRRFLLTSLHMLACSRNAFCRITEDARSSPPPLRLRDYVHTNLHWLLWKKATYVEKVLRQCSKSEKMSWFRDP